MSAPLIPGTAGMPSDPTIHLVMSNNSVRNTAITCDSLGIRYDVTKQNGIYTIQRWDPSTSRILLVGEFKLPDWSKDLIRFGPTGPWIPLKEFLNKGHGSIFSSNKSFFGANGVQYRWKEKVAANHGELALYEQMNRHAGPVVEYHRHSMSGKPSYLKIKDASVMNTLDTVIMTFLIMERKKRDRDEEMEEVFGV